MKKYFVSHVDFTEIAAVSTDQITLDTAVEKLTEAGAINAKKKPDVNYLNTLSATVSLPFFSKLQKRLSRRRGGITAVHTLMKNLYTGKEYTAMFLYLVIQYGFLEWQVPEMLTYLPAVPDALKAYMTEFIADFEEFIAELAAQEKFAQEETADGDDSE